MRGDKRELLIFITPRIINQETVQRTERAIVAL